MPDSGASAMEERFQSHELHRELTGEWAQAWPDLVQIMAGLAAGSVAFQSLASHAMEAYRQLTNLVAVEIEASRMPDGEQR